MNDSLDSVIDRWTPAVWLGGGVLIAVLAGAAIVPLVGAAEWAAGGVAVIAALVGSGASWRKRALDHLPLEFAPSLAEWEGPLGHHLTVRAWLGRGRRVDDLRIEVRAGDETLDVLAPGVPVVGCFHAVFPVVEGPVVVKVTGRNGGRSITGEVHYDADARVQGRFRPGFEIAEGWRWKRREWSRVG